MRIEQITFTRFLAALSIVIFHYGTELPPFNSGSVSFLFYQANLGVSYFFILSGFVMIVAYGRKQRIGTADYLKNRFARIYPVYFLALVLLFSYKTVVADEIDRAGLLANLFLLQAWIPGQALTFNAPGWSLSVELFFYLVFPVLFNRIYARYEAKKTGIYVLLIWAGTQLFLHWALSSRFYHGYPSKSHDLLFYSPLMHINEFLIGNLAGLFFVKHLAARKMNTDLAVLAMLIVFYMLLKFNPHLNFHDGLLAVIFIPLILLIAMNNGLISKLFCRPLPVFLGEISYGLYILQLPVYLWMHYTFDSLHKEQPALYFYSYLAVLVLFSALSYWAVEKPLREWIKKIRFTRS